MHTHKYTHTNSHICIHDTNILTHMTVFSHEFRSRKHAHVSPFNNNPALAFSRMSVLSTTTIARLHTHACSTTIPRLHTRACQSFQQQSRACTLALVGPFNNNPALAHSRLSVLSTTIPRLHTHACSTVIPRLLTHACQSFQQQSRACSLTLPFLVHSLRMPVLSTRRIKARHGLGFGKLHAVSRVLYIL